jgi:hypothetical protein
MDLLHLTQHVLLERGQAAPLYGALAGVQAELLHRNPKAGQRWSTTEALSLQPLATLTKRVLGLAIRDQVPLKPAKPGRRRKPPRPHRLRVKYDELATVRYYYARLLATVAHCSDEHPHLVAILGRFHQPSLNLESHISLVAAVGPGCQTSFA